MGEHDRLELEVVTPDRVEFAGTVDMVIAPGAEGMIGVMPGHTPFVTRLSTGVLQVVDSGVVQRMAVSDGYMEVYQNRVMVLAEAAEIPEEIDVGRALSAKRRAEERLAHRTEDTHIVRAQASLQRAINRLRVASEEEDKGD